MIIKSIQPLRRFTLSLLLQMNSDQQNFGCVGGRSRWQKGQRWLAQEVYSPLAEDTERAVTKVVSWPAVTVQKIEAGS